MTYPGAHFPSEPFHSRQHCGGGEVDLGGIDAADRIRTTPGQAPPA